MILALRTADLTTQLYLTDARGEVQHESTWHSGRDLSDQLLAKLQDFLGRNRCEFADLTGIAVFSGPGSFTSLRIGHSVANALADSLGVPVVGASGRQWLQRSAQALRTAKSGQPALPLYGAAAHITRPRS